MTPLVRWLAARATDRKVTALRGHDWEPTASASPLHFGVCPCGLGSRVLRTRRDWRDLAEHPPR